MKILLAVDGSSHTKKMLAYVSTHAELFHSGNTYTALHVQHPLPGRASAAVGAEIVRRYHDDESSRVLEPVTKFLARHGLDCSATWKKGAAGPVIARMATQGKFDLIVMGSHGHGGFLKLVMGSVATQVLAEGSTPVLLIR